MRIYLTRGFVRDASGEVTDENCRETIRKAENGLLDADLGGGLIKQRIPRKGQGASRGFRAILFYKRGELAIGLHMFPKSKKANLTDTELTAYLNLARLLDKLNEAQLEELAHKRGWRAIEP
jgi:hypothetical protein